MTLGGKKASFLLFLGDLAVFAFSLWLTLLIRYREIPTETLLRAHAVFIALFAVWTLVFFAAGLYGKRVVLFKSRLPDALLKTQAFNIILAAVFFFAIPHIGIAPKTNLLIYLVVSLALVFGWRLGLYPRVSGKSARENAALIASGPEADELAREVNGNPRYPYRFSVVRTPEEAVALAPRELERALADAKIALLVVDTQHASAAPFLPTIYHLARLERRYQFVPFSDMYEEVFDRIPLSLLQHAWFLENVSPATPPLYAFGKRVVDLIGGALMGAVTVVAMPFVWIANAIESPGPLFIAQERIGQGGISVRALKFRSMTKNNAASGTWLGEEDNRVTKVGSFLRRTSLDEFPQFMSVLRGELSLIGPRNDTAGLAARLAAAIPYYNARYLVKPGITGWAQINQQYEQNNISPQSIEETKTRLAYDFYYLKHRSFGLDLVIALKTVKRMLFRVSSW
jgi:lipopolysaccharide/colanic/teichoic acid biosynthesis glycosyltransferase